MPGWALATARYGQLPSVKVVRVPRRSQLGLKPIAASAVSSTSALERSAVDRRLGAADGDPGGLDLAWTEPAGDQSFAEPAGELAVGNRRLTFDQCPRGDRPLIVRTAGAGAGARAPDEARVGQSAEVKAGAVGMDPHASGKLRGRQAPPRRNEEREESRRGRLVQRIALVGGRGVHDSGLFHWPIVKTPVLTTQRPRL